MRLATFSTFALLSCCAVAAAQAPVPSPSPAPSQAAPQDSPSSSPTAAQTPARKVNERPGNAPASTGEPFDGATVERMNSQCVTLDTEAGSIELEMIPEAAPETVRNFLNLAATGMFDTTVFSRVVPGFVVQGGNLSTSSRITPQLAARSRRTIPDEPSYLKHERGVVSMARPDEPNKATTHFFILVADAPFLDHKFAAFARVTRGMEVADQINRAEVNGDKPVKPVVLRRASVSACPPKEARPAH